MNYNFNKQTFCTQPFSNLQISVQGLYKVCCLANDDADRGHIKDENGNYLHVLDHDISEVFNSITHREHRLQLSKNEAPVKCINCYDKESANNGKGSTRQVRNGMKDRIIEIVDITEADSLMKPDGSIDRLPISLDIRFGNLCNAKCIMCNAAHSSLWMEDAVKLHGNSAYTMFGTDISNFGAKERWWESPIWWEKFSKIAPNLKHIYILGGEPLIVPEHDTLLEKLIEWGFAKDIELSYDTNLTVINPKLISLWKQFKNIILRISVDETGDRYHFVRYPSKWDRLLKNIKTLRENDVPILCFTSSIGIPTIYSPFRLEKFSKDFHISYAQRFLYTPHNMDITILPPSAKEEIINTYRKNTGQSGLAENMIINHLSKYFDKHDPEAISSLIQYMDQLDKIRGTNWKSTLPDVYDLLTRYCPDSFK